MNRLSAVVKLLLAGLVLAFSDGPLTAQDQDLERLAIHANEMVFDARAAGPKDGSLILMLHGFPQTSYAFRHQIRGLAKLGFRVVAPDQRGYSPGARPDAPEAYAMSALMSDVAALADALHARSFHLVGHDWGGAVAWAFATRFPDRLRSLTVLSTPHYGALAAGRATAGSEQAQRSAYFTDFAAPGAEQRFLANAASYLRSIYGDLPREAVDTYLAALAEPAAMRAALAWYRAAFGNAAPSAAATASATAPRPVRVPTMYIWSTEDSAFSREAAEATRNFVDAPFRFEVLDGIDHWVAERAPERVTQLIAEHVATQRQPR